RVVLPPSINLVHKSNTRLEVAIFALPQTLYSSDQSGWHRPEHGGSSAHSASRSDSPPRENSAEPLARRVLPIALATLLPSGLSALPAPYGGCCRSGSRHRIG